MSELVLYTNPRSRGRIARWALEEVGQPYETVVLEYGTTMKAPEYLAINPMGKVPALRHGDRIVTEAAAICTYLAETFPDAGLTPRPEERADYYRWLFFAAGPLEAAITNRALGVVIPPERKAMVGYGSYEDVLGALSQAVKTHPYIAGDRFTMADVYVGSHVRFGLQFGTIEDRPEFRAYLARVQDRPAARRAEEKEDALLPKGA
jgi:glutathione S-transferase